MGIRFLCTTIDSNSIITLRLFGAYYFYRITKKMKKIYHLSTCSTCQRIIKELQLPNDFVFQDIKTEIITTAQIEEMRELSQNYEALFSKRAVLYRERNLKEQNLTENDFKALILEHYTFLKRPVILVDNLIFIGNSKKVVEAAKKAIHP